MDISPVPYEVRYRILSIDPGTRALGLAIIDVNIETDQKYVIKAFTGKRAQLNRKKPWIEEVHGEAEAAVYLYRELVSQQMDIWDPCAVVSEIPYMGRFPKAFQRLTEVVLAIRFAVMDWDINYPLNEVEPSAAKKNIGVPGQSKDKTLIPKALSKRKDLHFLPGCELAYHDEHVHDAVAVGLHYVDHKVSMIID